MHILKNACVFLFLLAVLLTVAIQYLIDPVSPHLIFNADGLYLPTLFDDLFAKGGHLSHWYLTPAPYFFPDYLLFYVAYLVMPNAYLQIGFFSLLQITLTFFGLWLLTRQFFEKDAAIVSLTITVLLVCFAQDGGPFIPLFMSAYHFGAFIAAIFFAALWLQYYYAESGSKTSRMIIVMIHVIAFCTSLSDKSFLLWAALPASLASIVMHVFQSQMSIKRICAYLMPCMSSILGIVLYKFIVVHNTEYVIIFGFDQIKHRFGIMMILLLHMLEYDFVYVVLFMWYLNLLVQWLYQCKSAPYALDVMRRQWLLYFSLLSIGLVMGLLLLMTNVGIALRYCMPLFFWPVIISILFFSDLIKKRRFIVYAMSTFCMVGMLAYHNDVLLKDHRLQYDYYPKHMACIDQALTRCHVSNGIAAYWDAKYMQTFSRLDLNVAQYVGEVQPMLWITSRDYFKAPYDFAIINTQGGQDRRINIQALNRINGHPRQIVTCGDRQLYVYGQGQLKLPPVYPSCNILKSGDNLRRYLYGC